MVCPYCHKEIPEDSVYCYHCGKELNQQQISPEVKSSIEHFINLSEEMEDESQSMLYLAAFIDSYRFFKALGLVIC